MYGPEYWRLFRIWPQLVRHVGLAPGQPPRSLIANGIFLCDLFPGHSFDVSARIRAVNKKECALRAALASGSYGEFEKLKATVEDGDILLAVCDDGAIVSYTDAPRRPRLSRCGLQWRLEVVNMAELVFNEDPLRRPPLAPLQLWGLHQANRGKIRASVASLLCLARLGLPVEVAWQITILAVWV